MFSRHLQKKNKNYDCQTWNTKGSIDVKEQTWQTNVKYLRLLPMHLMAISILYTYIHMCTIYMWNVYELQEQFYGYYKYDYQTWDIKGIIDVRNNYGLQM